MPKLYVSYRNADRSASFTALSDALDARFGTANVTKDAIAFAGADYIATLDGAIMTADAVLVVIGPHWLSATNAAGDRKIDQTNDVVHYEVAKALEFGKALIVVQIDDAPPLTAASLPTDIAALSVQPHMRYATPADLDHLLPSVAMSENATASTARSTQSSLGLMVAIIAGIVTALTICPVEIGYLFSVSTYLYLFVPHLLFLLAWVLGIVVAAQQRRWGWLAALVIPVMLFLVASLWLYIQVLQSTVPGAADILLVPIFASYEAEGLLGIVLIIFGLLVAGKISFHWHA